LPHDVPTHHPPPPPPQPGGVMVAGGDIVTVTIVLLQFVGFTFSHILYGTVYVPESAVDGTMRFHERGSRDAPVRLFDPVRVTVTVPVETVTPERLSFARIATDPVFPVTNDPESASAEIGVADHATMMVIVLSSRASILPSTPLVTI